MKNRTRATPLGIRRFGAWTSQGLWESRPGGRYWLCLCDCGTERFVRATALVHGQSRSCGCGIVPTREPSKKRPRHSVIVEYRFYSNTLKRFLPWDYFGSVTAKKAAELIRKSNPFIEYREKP